MPTSHDLGVGPRVGIIAGGLPYERSDTLQAAATIIRHLSGLGFLPSVLDLVDPGCLNGLDSRTVDRCFIVDPFYTQQLDGITHILDARTRLEIVGVPYTGTGRSAAAICRDKTLSKRFFAQVGVRSPRDLGVPPCASLSWSLEAIAFLGSPVVLKPRTEGQGVGVSLCHDGSDLAHAVEAIRGRFPDLMVEEYIPGMELTVPVVGRGDGAFALPPVELELMDSPIYDYATKLTPERVLRFVPARLPEDELARLRDSAVAVHRHLGCGGATRIDFRVPRLSACEHYCLEINSSPTLTQDDHVARAAIAAGIDYSHLILLILGDAHVHPMSEEERG